VVSRHRRQSHCMPRPYRVHDRNIHYKPSLKWVLQFVQHGHHKPNKYWLISYYQHTSVVKETEWSVRPFHLNFCTRWSISTKFRMNVMVLESWSLAAYLLISCKQQGSGRWLTLTISESTRSQFLRALKIESGCSSKKLVQTYGTTRCAETQGTTIWAITPTHH
jgi:hypothetical protein